MRILAIDTSTKFLCLAIYDRGKTYSCNVEVGKKLSSLLAVLIQRSCSAAAVKISDIDYFCVGLGPGSFTGMRIGVSVIKALGWALGKPVLGISSLDIIAQNADAGDRPIIPVVDAKRNLIYCSFYRKDRGRLSRVKPYLLISPQELAKTAPSGSVILGDAAQLHKQTLLSQVKGVTILDKDYWYPKAHNLVKLALEKIRAKKKTSPLAIEPIYLYPKECQIRQVKRAGR